VGTLGRFSRRRHESGHPPRVLLIRPDHLGDVLLASPAETILRAAMPDAEIDWRSSGSRLQRWGRWGGSPGDGTNRGIRRACC